MGKSYPYLEPVGQRTERMDTRRNRAKLLRAIREIGFDDPEHISMPEIAERAELSSSTAYRYFPSVGDLIDAYRIEVVRELLDFQQALDLKGTELFEAVARERGRLHLTHGPTMTRLRSHTGFLSRLDGDEEVIRLVKQVWTHPIEEVLREFELPSSHLPYALFLCNLLFDAREYLDLVDAGGLSPEDASTHLIRAFYGALKAW